jgi:hypothetical protein
LSFRASTFRFGSFVLVVGKRELGLCRVRAEAFAARAIGLEAAGHLAAPVRGDGKVTFGLGCFGTSRRWGRLLPRVLREARVAEAAGASFGGIHGAALRTGLNHRLVLRCGRFPRGLGRRDAAILSQSDHAGKDAEARVSARYMAKTHA